MGPDSLHLILLDGFDVHVGSEPVTIKGARSCQVLAYLALHQGTTVSVDRLCDALWGETQPASARNSVQRFVSDLRRDLGPGRARIASVGNGYRLALGDDDWCDAVALERSLPVAREALVDGRPGDAVSLIGDLATALAEPLASVEGAVFASLERSRLSELMADCGEVDAEARLAQGDSAGAVTSARRLLEQHPYRERLCITLATALTKLGRANEALDAVASFRSRLREDLGLEPSPAVEQTELDILLHRDAAPLGSLEHHSFSQSGSLTSVNPEQLYGRDYEVDHAVELLRAKQVVTLTGTGGIGKTSAALAVIDSWQRQHAGATRFVSFEEITAQGIAVSVGQVVGTSSKADHDPLGEVVDRICAEVDLLVLDNCEHIAEEVGVLVDEIVKRSSEVRILATSRRPLGKVYEQLLPLKPLDSGNSRQLLKRQLDSAGVQISDLDPDSIVELLEEMDGLPLAIELASASLRSVGVRDLLSRWRNDEPAPSHTIRQERHLSIANAVKSTLGQLDAGQLELLGLCALFPADFDSAAIEALSGTPVSQPLQELRDHSLLEVNQTETRTRYRMLVPIRAEIRAQSGPLNRAHQEAFVSYFEELACRCLEQMKGTESLAGVSSLRADLSNIAVAFNFADESDDVPAMASMLHCVGLANGMSPSVGAKTHLQDWGERLRARIAAGELNDVVLAKAQTAAAWGLYGSSDGAWYQRWEAETRSDDMEAQAMAAIARFSRGESTTAWELLSGLELTASADPYMRAMLCGVGAVIAFTVGAEAGDALTDAAISASTERASHGASFFAGLARSNQASSHGNSVLCVSILEEAAGAIDGHGLVTLENMGLAGVAMTVGFLLREHDPAHLLIGILDRYLEQHSLDPASVAMALDVSVLHLDHLGRTEEAASLLGLLDRLGLSMAILRGPRAGLEAKIDAQPDWVRARAAGSTKSTFDVLRSARTAFAEVVDGSRSST